MKVVGGNAHCKAAEQHYTNCNRRLAVLGYRAALCNASKHVTNLTVKSLSRLVAMNDLEFVEDKLKDLSARVLDADVAIVAEVAHLYQSLGRFDQANHMLETLLQRAPKDPVLYRMYFASKLPENLDNVYLKNGVKLWRELSGADEYKLQLGFALGNAYFELGDYDTAFQYLDAANGIQSRRHEYNALLRRAQFEQMRELQRHMVSYRSRSCAGITPLFISGMPRTGTTLLDRWMCRSFEVLAGNEFRYSFDLIYSGLVQKRRELDTPELKTKALMRFAKAYRRFVHRDTGAERGYVSDKNMQTYLTVGYLLAAFADAKVIFVERDPRATALSVYRNHFASGSHIYSNSWSNIAAQIKLHQDAVQYWTSMYPDRVTVINYHELVTQKDDELARLGRFAGLKPQNANRQESVERITTLSFKQSRGALHQKSLSLWEQCEAHMLPFLNHWAAISK